MITGLLPWLALACAVVKCFFSCYDQLWNEKKKKQTWASLRGEKVQWGAAVGWLPMRKEIVWNAGMHSHPKCLNKLAVNEAVNGEERETTIRSVRGETDHPSRELQQNLFQGTSRGLYFLIRKDELTQKWLPDTLTKTLDLTDMSILERVHLERGDNLKMSGWTVCQSCVRGPIRGVTHCLWLASERWLAVWLWNLRKIRAD